MQASSGAVALVTGGAARVGRGIVEGLAAAGYRVWVHHFESEVGPTDVLGTIRADLRVAAQRDHVCSTVLAPDGPAAGRLDLLVNNAASFERGSFAGRSDADLARVLELNLVAPLALIRGCLPALRATSGCVVNILDRGATHPWPEHVDHCASKAALASATRALAVELAPVRVVGVAPGTVAFPESLDAAGRARIERAIPRGRIGSPADVASAVAFLASAPHISGAVLTVDGGRLAGIGGGYG